MDRLRTELSPDFNENNGAEDGKHMLASFQTPANLVSGLSMTRRPIHDKNINFY